MSIVLAAALAASTATVPSCSWDRPGVNPFVGDVVAAVDRYTDIPEATRAALKARMAKRQYDEVATITRDAIAGRQRYTNLRDMHFGAGRVCQTVTRDRWSPTTTERGLVYCADGHCIIVPTVCRNVSRVTREPQARAANEGSGDAGAEPPQTVANLPFPAPPVEQGELRFEAPSAGLTPTSLSDGLRDPIQTLALATPGLIGGSGGGGSSDGTDALPGVVDPDTGTSALPTGSRGSFGEGSGFGGFPGADGTGGSGGTGGTGGSGNPGGSGGDPGTGGGSEGDPAPPPGGHVVPNDPGVPPISPIPEPSTWILMLGGLAVVGAAARRRAQTGRPR